MGRNQRGTRPGTAAGPHRTRSRNRRGGAVSRLTTVQLHHRFDAARRRRRGSGLMPRGVSMSHQTLEDAAVTFLGFRDRLYGIAFRIMNDSAAAEDIVQDAWVRWQTCDRSVVLDPLAFLTTTTKRLCINVLQSARARHETHTGSWLPDPVDPHADPQRRVEQCEALELAALTLLERLSPPERAAYVLREAFDYSY